MFSRALIGWVGLAVALAFADRATKEIVLGAFRVGEAREVTGFFNLVLTFNRGAAFSLLAEASGWQRGLFIAIAVVAIVVILWMLAREGGDKRFSLALALILGGALGNLWDRIALGYVIDFLDFHAAGHHWPAFNLADAAITVGAALLIADGLLQRRERHK